MIHAYSVGVGLRILGVPPTHFEMVGPFLRSDTFINFVFSLCERRVDESPPPSYAPLALILNERMQENWIACTGLSMLLALVAAVAV